MNKEVFEDPGNLVDKGFDYEEDGTADIVRMVYYTKEIPIAETGYTFIVKVTYELSISDDPFASYTENRRYYFEKMKCFLQDEGGNELFVTRARIDSLEDFNTLEYFFSR